MNLQMPLQLAQGYTSRSQVARVLTEAWLQDNAFCPNCGNPSLQRFCNNRPAADFYCGHCHEEFELKSTQGKIQATVIDGAYGTMLERVQSENNPNLFLLSYTEQYAVSDFLLIPKHFFTPSIIIQRPPLAVTAKRAGWIGCNIAIGEIPESGKIHLVKNGQVKMAEQVIQDFNRTLFLREKLRSGKGWILDVMNCIDALNKEIFSLAELYCFEKQLGDKYPDNFFIKDKIRQQLQLLRDNGLLEFMGNGIYRKL